MKKWKEQLMRHMLLLKKYDANPNNSFNECIKFWYAKEDFKPFASDDLGQSAVDSINRLFIDKPYPAQEGLTQKILAAKNYWESIKK